MLGPDTAVIEAFISNPARTMMGPGQEAWLADTLARSAAARPWQVIGNEVVMARIRSPKVEQAIGAEGVRKILDGLPPRSAPRWPSRPS